MMAAVDMNNTGRKKGMWYAAVPPLCREWTGLTPADYFGRTLVERLPENIKVGVINVAVGGCSIDLFDEDKTAAVIEKSADWFMQGLRQRAIPSPYGDGKEGTEGRCYKRYSSPSGVY